MPGGGRSGRATVRTPTGVDTAGAVASASRACDGEEERETSEGLPTLAEAFRGGFGVDPCGMK